ncbi:MAG TPA: hypothetical protein VH300_05625 [Thermoleophilaceae bacterium]|nr:hypothetical protein [Thermoleophilaceae bacterium]
MILAPTALADHWHDPNWTPDPNSNPGQNWDDPYAPSSDPAPATGGDSNQSTDPWADPWSPSLPVSNTPTVAGKTAMIRRNGLAAVPKGAPAQVRAIISAANQIIGKPYKWGGGHGRLFDSGYDCSGSVSYALIRAGLLGYPMVSGTFARWGAKGVGTFVTIYANKSHAYMEVAGLRLDTSSVGDRGGKSGVRWRTPIGKRFGFAVRHIAGL